MLCYVNAVANKNAFPGILKIGLKPFFMQDVNKYKTTIDANMCEILFPICPSFFTNQFFVIPALYK